MGELVGSERVGGGGAQQTYPSCEVRVRGGRMGCCWILLLGLMLLGGWYRVGEIVVLLV